MEKHRSIAQCTACHRKIDPYGMALENFDVIGAWRTRYRALDATNNPRRPQLVEGPYGDCAGPALQGDRFEGFLEFRRLLLERDDQLHENLAEKLAVFALGRTMGFADEEDLRQIVAETKEQGGVRSMIHALVRSPMFFKP